MSDDNIFHVVFRGDDHTVGLHRKVGGSWRKHYCKTSNYSAMRLQSILKNKIVQSIYFGYDITRISFNEKEG